MIGKWLFRNIVFSKREAELVVHNTQKLFVLTPTFVILFVFAVKQVNKTSSSNAIMLAKVSYRKCVH